MSSSACFYGNVSIYEVFCVVWTVVYDICLIWIRFGPELIKILIIEWVSYLQLQVVAAGISWYLVTYVAAIGI